MASNKSSERIGEESGRTARAVALRARAGAQVAVEFMTSGVPEIQAEKLRDP